MKWQDETAGKHYVYCISKLQTVMQIADFNFTRPIAEY